MSLWQTNSHVDRCVHDDDADDGKESQDELGESHGEPFVFGCAFRKDIGADRRCEESDTVDLSMEVVDLPRPDAFGNAGEEQQGDTV